MSSISFGRNSVVRKAMQILWNGIGGLTQNKGKHGLKNRKKKEKFNVQLIFSKPYITNKYAKSFVS